MIVLAIGDFDLFTFPNDSVGEHLQADVVTNDFGVGLFPLVAAVEEP